MSVTDTREYWDDVKAHINKKVFVHAKSLDCGHFHVHETYDISMIDCYACKKHLDENPALFHQLMVAHKKREKQRMANRKRKHKKKA
jgi:hypothetical protein